MREPRCAISLILSHSHQIGAITLNIVIYNLNNPVIPHFSRFTYRDVTSRKRFS